MENRPGGREFHGQQPRGRGRGYRGGNQGGRGAQHRLARLRENWRERPDNNQGNNNNDNQQPNDRPRRNHNERSRPERTMGFPYVQKLLNNEDLQEVILQLSNDRNGFTKLLDSKEISYDLIVLLVKLLCKVCSATFQDVKIMILSMALQSRFMEKLTLYVTQLISQAPNEKLRNRYFWDDPDDFWNNLITLSKTVQEIIPTNCETIRKLLKTMTVFFNLTEGIHISDEIKAQTVSMLDIVEKTVQNIEVRRQKLQHGVALQEDMEPPDDFRHMEIIPSVQEIVAEFSPFLRPNIVDKAFSSVNQYLDIQFRLLREDFVAPLRRGISTFLRNQAKPKKEWKKLDDIKVYSPIRFVSVETVNECNCYRMRFDFTKKKRSFTYENSKRFMFGSLVCFTCDNFKTILFGKIVQRDMKLLEQGLLIVGFQEQVNINYEVDYLMVESSVYFEPYYQVLGVLKKMDLNNFPMEKYIIKVETESKPPEYLLQAEPVFYEIEKTKFWALNFPNEQRFYNLNDSQLSAFKAALTEEFCIIQGPPGTGKTFLGLKIAHTLLNNQSAWYKRTPILVICYTNHALDQFLEGILPVTKNILRVGGQSRDENLKMYNLAVKRRNINNQAAVHQKRREVRDYMEHIKTLSETLNQIDLNEGILSFSSFKEVVENFNETWFGRASQDDVKKWLLEGKMRERERFVRNRNDPRQVEEEIQPVGGDERIEDLGVQDEDLNADWLDDIFNNILIRGYMPLITLEQLKSKLNLLNRQLETVYQQEESLDNILWEEKIQLEIWETETDLDYITEQLTAFQDRRQRRKPAHVDLTNPFNMRPHDRWKLYFYWVEQYAAQLRRKYGECSNRFREVFRVYNEMRDIEDTQLMKQHLVVGMTTTGASRLQSSLQALRSPIVIVEEAAEVLEAHIVAALTNHCKHLILIGDHLQLKPGAADFQIQTRYKLGISLFERMVKNNIHCHTLNVQHRMRPEISRLIKPHIYQNLEDHESTLQRPPILGVEKCIYFIDHQEQEEVCQDASKKNIHESHFLIAFARHLVLNGYKPEQITILAAYLGQFFEMIRERKKPNNMPFLADVRIAVLDNYQGEESDIILLSLVRSNAENKAGFLRIQNRVCVALSRARDGFYIMGNMSLLLRSDSENQIWDKVKAVLEEQDAIGTHLTLKCQIHPYRLTQVSKSQDFVKLSEGGCDQMCEAQIACGHICKRLCHVQDRDHERYNCNEKCSRFLCNDPAHMCKKRCYEECGPCTYLVSRDLDCGHTVNIECHIDANKYKCPEPVLTKLPCDHQADKPCSADPNVFRCPHPCDTRVEPCGHACDRQCHIRMDPDHLKYKCRQPCAKPRIGCRELKNKHDCPRFCYQDCEPCTIGVKKFRSCGHVFTVACKLDVEDVQCEKPCKKELFCGHPCKNECSETCGPCEVMVEKTISECQHTVKIRCHMTPMRQHCKSRTCPRLLPCGHQCTKPCRVDCTDTCTVMMDCKLEAPCGHTLTTIQCSVKNTNDAELLLKYCTEKCKVKLNCKHECSGSCGECMQSRIHKRCAKKCGVPLVCNHECPIPCREACKPCTRPCEMRCKHSKCKKNCGEPCTPCRVRPCPRRCPHVECSKTCGDICNVPPCYEKCKRRLKCGHPCVGFCGNPCPPLCRICNREELTEIFFGTEEEEDAIFVLLNDCKHVLEHSGLEKWLNQDSDRIQFKNCPKCKTVITTTERYSGFVKRAIRDVIMAKIKSYGESKENEALRQQLIADLDQLKSSAIMPMLKVSDKMKEILEVLDKRLQRSREQRRQPINKIELNAVKAKIQILNYIVNCFKDTKLYTCKHPTILHLSMLLEVLLRSEDHVTNQEIEDIELEIKRLNRIIQFDKIKQSSKFEYAQSTPSVKTLANDIQDVLFVKKRYSDFLDTAVKNNLTDLVAQVDCTVHISDKERMEIVQAIGLTRGHWFKCPNGHPYAIGECGGAMQVARCFCGAQIGGTDHRLLPSNQLAAEMDGANRHAFPGGLH